MHRRSLSLYLALRLNPIHLPSTRHLCISRDTTVGARTAFPTAQLRRCGSGAAGQAIENRGATPQLIAQLPEWFYVMSNRNESGGGVVTKSAVTISVDEIVVLKGKLAVLPSAPTVST